MGRMGWGNEDNGEEKEVLEEEMMTTTTNEKKAEVLTAGALTTEDDYSNTQTSGGHDPCSAAELKQLLCRLSDDVRNTNNK
jgi:hypothetical protein